MRRLGGSAAFALVVAALAMTSASATSYVAAGDILPTWSPDGTRIAFTATMRDGANWDRRSSS
jgi:Tol biopolymer transport system component